MIIILTVEWYLILHLNVLLLLFKCTKLQLHYYKCVITNIFKCMPFKLLGESF